MRLVGVLRELTGTYALRRQWYLNMQLLNDKAAMSTASALRPSLTALCNVSHPS